MDKIEAKIYIRIFIFFICCAIGLHINAQETIRGFVLDSISKEPITNAMVYFDRTSIGTVTNKKGYFEIIKPTGITTPLIISYLGYEKISLENLQKEQPLKIFLTEKTNWLKSVVITGETNKMENEKLIKANGEQKEIWFEIFENHFIGTMGRTRRIYIKNDEALIFKYNPKTKTVYVSAREPLKISNPFLKYEITYNLETLFFDLQWLSKINKWAAKNFYAAGTSFFTDMLDPEDDSERKIERIHERRKEAFLGSITHFMRALVNSKLTKAGYDLYKTSKFDQRLYANFLRIQEGELTKVVPPGHFVIEYNRHKTEVIALLQSFSVDKYGNFHPWRALKFKGYMSKLGIALAVPLNYGLQVREK